MSGGIVRTLHADDALDLDVDSPLACELARAFRLHGALVLPGFLVDDDLFTAMQSDLGRLPRGAEEASALLSVARVRTHPAFGALAEALFGEGALVAEARDVDLDEPSALDGIHAASTLAIWVKLGRAGDDAGVLTIWPGSHKLVHDAVCDGTDASEATAPHGLLAHLEAVDLVVDTGDVVVMDASLRYREGGSPSRGADRGAMEVRYANLAPGSEGHRRAGSTSKPRLTLQASLPGRLTG